MRGRRRRAKRRRCKQQATRRSRSYSSSSSSPLATREYCAARSFPRIIETKDRRGVSTAFAIRIRFCLLHDDARTKKNGAHELMIDQESRHSCPRSHLSILLRLMFRSDIRTAALVMDSLLFFFFCIVNATFRVRRK